MINPLLTIGFQLFLIGSASTVIVGMIREYRASLRPTVGVRAAAPVTLAAVSGRTATKPVGERPPARVRQQVGARSRSSRASAPRGGAAHVAPYSWGASVPRSARRSALLG